MKNIKIVSIIENLNLTQGGPSQGVLNLAQTNINNNITHEIVNLRNKNTNINSKVKIINLDQSYFKYGISIKLILWLLKNKKNYDLFIMHGIWQFQNLCARIIIPGKYIVLTHGMLDPYFETEKIKSIKKKLYWFFFEKKNLLNSKYVLANSAIEYKQYKETYVNTSGIKFKKINYGILPHKINIKNSIKIFNKKFKFLRGKRIILYLGRLHKKKGCELLIKAYSKLKNINNYILLIAGEHNNDYFLKLKKYVDENNLKNKVFFSGFVLGDLKWGAILRSDCTILTSYGENFGVSIIESLFCGKPVICSQKVGISQIIKNYNAGLIVKNNIISIQKQIKNFIEMSKKNKKKLSKNSIKCFNEKFNLKNINDFSNLINATIKKN